MVNKHFLSLIILSTAFFVLFAYLFRSTSLFPTSSINNAHRKNNISGNQMFNRDRITMPEIPDEFDWLAVSESEMKTNKGVLFWIIDLRKCFGLGNETCRNPEDFYSFETDMPGKEWLYYHKVNNANEAYGYQFAVNKILEQSKSLGWENWKYQIKPGFDVTPLQGVDSGTYQPTCILKANSINLRTACFTWKVDEDVDFESFPYTEEFRYFISDPVTIESLLLDIEAKIKK